MRAREPQPVTRSRTHGDPTGGQRRPQRDEQRRSPVRDDHRRPVREPQQVTTDLMRRRRTNVLFMLVALVGATLFLAATTQSAAMLYVFAIAFLALCAYGYMLSQVRQRESSAWPQDWMQH